MSHHFAFRQNLLSVQAALFAGFLSAFLIELLNRLEPDPMDIIQDVLIYQTQMMRNSSLGPYVPADFSPPEYIVLVNALFYASLGVMILAAFVAMLIKSWVHEFDRGLRAISIPEQRAKTREFRYLGMERWKLQEMAAMLPLLIQLSLLLFAIGFVLFLFHISTPSFGVTTAIFGVGVFYYATTTTISVFVTSSPFHSPLSRALGRVYQYVHAYFCPGLDEFLSPNMDTTPVAAFGRLRRRIQIFLQKSRPYLERNFVEPITAMTIDEVQLSTAASALQRIHDSVPNSQHSELIQQSVWQVIGSPALRMRPLLRLPPWILERGNDKEYVSQLPPASMVALTAVFVRMRDPRYKKRIVGLADLDIHRAMTGSQGPLARVVPAIFDLLPDDFIYHSLLNDVDLRRALRHDALLRDALGDAPSMDALRDSLLRIGLVNIRTYDAGIRSTWHRYRPGLLLFALSNHPMYMFNDPHRYPRTTLWDAFRDAFRDTPLRVIRALLRDALFGNARFDDMTSQGRIARAYLEHEEPVDLIDILQTNRLHDAESIWLLNTLSGLHCDGLVGIRDHVSKICLAILLHQAPEWNRITPPNIMLLEAVVTFSTISRSSNGTYQIKTLTNSHQHPWLLLNIRNPEVVSRMTDETGDSSREELISLLFLVIYALTLRGSKALAEHYLVMITAKADFAFCASALTVIAPALGDDGFRVIGKLLLSPRRQFFTPPAGGSVSNNMANPPQLRRGHQTLFNSYDLQIGANESPDPKIAAILLLLSKDLSSKVRRQLQSLNLNLRNPWLQLAASMIINRRVPDGSSMDIRPFPDHRVHNMLGALSLPWYFDEDGIIDRRGGREHRILNTFLGSMEPAISFPVLYKCIEWLDESVLPLFSDRHGALHLLFNPTMPDHHLPRGWDILRTFTYWHRRSASAGAFAGAIAEAFFTLSQRPLLKRKRKRQNDTPSTKDELRDILTWEYFCKEEEGPGLTDEGFSGLDWMAMAWSLYLSKHPGTKLIALTQRGPYLSDYLDDWLDEQFVLEALCRLLEAAPHYSIIPNIPKLREFVQWFGDPEHVEWQSMISARVEEAFHRHQECRTLYEFQKFHCMWPL